MNNGKLYVYLFSLAVTTLFTMQSCVRDNCDKLKCLNEGVCVQDKCACKYGFEGDLCEKQWFEKFAGNWVASEKDRQGVVLLQYDINALYFRATDSFIIVGLANKEDTIVARRKSYRSFTIVNKKLSGKDSMMGGEATLNDDATVTGLYSLRADTVDRNVLFSWSR